MENKKCRIALQSQTYTMKAIMLLAEHSIKARSVLINPTKTDKGCTVGIELDCTDFIPAQRILSKASIKYGVPR